jgi:hypothetical protein
MPQGQLETATAEQQMDGVEPLLRLLVGTTVDGKFQLGKGAGFRIWKLTNTTDSGVYP